MAIRAEGEQIIDTICRLLIEEYGDVIVTRALDPISELVFTILSQNTTDINTERAFNSLQEAYSSWDAVLDAPQDELALTIKSSGPFRIKAKRIKATLAEVKRRVGVLDLSLLETMETNQAMEWLKSLHGVGPKTAAIVLLFCFKRPVLPVDTHVWRVSKRLGIIPNNSSREAAQKMLEGLVPEYCVYSMNNNLIKHGRTICRSQNPLCQACFLRNHCKYYLNLQSSEEGI